MKDFLLKDALKNNYAVGAFNFSTVEVLKAIIAAAESQNSPIIAQVSESAISFMGEEYLKDIIKSARKQCKVPISFHLDHGKSYESAVKAIDMGCDSVMIDSGLYNTEAVVLGIEMFRRILPCAEVGDNCGIFLNISKDRIRQGDILKGK